MEQLSSTELKLYQRVAWYYYMDKMTQNEIAIQLGTNRQKINRILNECIDLGIVKIEVIGAQTSLLELESQLKDLYNLQYVRVIQNRAGEDILDALGRACNRFLTRTIKDNDIIACTRGRAISAVADKAMHSDKKNLTVVQLMGGWNSYKSSHADMDEVVHRLAANLGAEAAVLFAPVVLQSTEIRAMMVQEPFIREVFEKMKKSRIAIVGIGDLSGQQFYKTLFQNGESNEEIFNNAVGEIATHFFDSDGNIVKTDFQDKLIAIAFEDYLKIPIRLGVAAAREKVKAVRGALKGELINSLITDKETAESILDDS